MPSFEEEAGDWWGREQIRIDRFVGFFFDDPLGALIARGMVGDPEVAQAQRRRLDKQTRGAARNIARGKELGFVAEGIEPDLTGALLMGAIYQALSVTLRQESPPDPRRLASQFKTFMARVLGIQSN